MKLCHYLTFSFKASFVRESILDQIDLKSDALQNPALSKLAATITNVKANCFAAIAC